MFHIFWPVQITKAKLLAGTKQKLIETEIRQRTSSGPHTSPSVKHSIWTCKKVEAEGDLKRLGRGLFWRKQRKYTKPGEKSNKNRVKWRQLVNALFLKRNDRRKYGEQNSQIAYSCMRSTQDFCPSCIIGKFWQIQTVLTVEPHCGTRIPR